MLVGAGAVQDQQGGEAFLTSQSLLLGAGGKSKQQLEQQTDFIGASLVTSNDKEASYLNMTFMQKDTAAMLDLLAAVLRQPEFNPEEFTKLHARLVAQQQQAKESPRNVISRYFDSLLYGNHPYAKPTTGTEQSLAALNLADVSHFYQRHYQPDNIAIAVAGDFDIAELSAMLAGRFASWHGASVSTSELREVSKPATARVLLVDKPDATETTLMIGGVGVSQNNPDYVGLEVVNTILGGRFTSWLNDELRVNSGLTYGARSGFSKLVPLLKQKQPGKLSSWRWQRIAGCGSRALIRPRSILLKLMSKASFHQTTKLTTNWPIYWSACIYISWITVLLTTLNTKWIA